tara:strand:- start:8570 stop:10993 length:2424 start_codon:yes stop_codon:yes gene_type:complete
VQVAKDLNISHRDILDFLAKMNIKVKSHMSPLDEISYQMVIEEFEKDLATVERYRKEKTRKEIHTRMLEEKMTEGSSLEILMPQEKKIDNDDNKDKQEIEIKFNKVKEDEASNKNEVEKSEPKTLDKSNDIKLNQKETKKEQKSSKPKFRKVDLTEIQSKIENPRKKVKNINENEKDKDDSSVTSTIKRTLAAIDNKGKKKKYKKDKSELDEELNKEEIQKIHIRDYMSVQELAEVLDVSPTDIIGKCLELGMIATMNQRLEFDTSSLISEEYGFKALLLEEKINEIKEEKEEEIDESLLKPRAPVVTIMGHVDHGKTSLLDYIRNENVVAGEAGGITQHIGAYEVHLNNDPTKSVTFLDTPGHQAFTAMRARGAQVTDVVILIVAADDGVKPQTIEAIDHAKAANVPIVVAINKIDKKNINTDLVKKELSEHGVLVEDWGGKVQCMPVSAKNGIGIDELLELLALETEVLELKANPDSFAVATVVESRLDKGHGAIATVLIQRGTLEVGNVFICGNFNGKVRALMNERNKRVDKAGPSQPVQVLGFQSVPQAGDVLKVVSDEKTAKRISIERDRVQREINRQKIHTMSLDKISADIRDGASKVLPLLVKSDVDGSMEALIGAISDIPSDEVKVDIVHKSVGIITESDVLLAAASNAVIIGFNINMNANASLVAKKNGVEVRIYNVIYDAINEIKLALEGLLEPDIIEKITGKAEVLQVFKITKLGIIAGSKVLDGKILSSDMVKVLRKDEKIYTGKISSLKHFQEDVKEVDSGKECGIGLEKMKNFEPGDIIESYTTEEIKRTLSK